MSALVWKLLRQHISIGDIFGRERVAFSGKGAECADFLGCYDKVFFHKAVSFGEYGNDIFVKLYAEQYNHHAEQVG